MIPIIIGTIYVAGLILSLGIWRIYFVKNNEVDSGEFSIAMFLCFVWPLTIVMIIYSLFILTIKVCCEWFILNILRVKIKE